MGYLYIFGTVVFTVYGQIILKWRIAKYGTLPLDFLEKLIFLLRLFFDPFILSGFFSGFIASLFWMAAMTKFEISFAYPFMSFSFVFVFVLSIVLFGEAITIHKIVGLTFIVIGIWITSKSL